jgi:vacuolar-type H+-ATPase subunit C/Vma6
MREEFFIEPEENDVYSYISGRIKVLETMLLSAEILRKIASLPISDIYKELMETPYRMFLSGTDTDSISRAIFARHEAEISDISKYISPGFINVFFRDKLFFLKLKKWVFVFSDEELEGLDREIKNFLETGRGDFPPLFKEVFDMMKKEKDEPYKVGWLIDLFHVKYLLQSAEETKSVLIKEFYETYAEGKIFIFLERLSNFVLSHEIKEKDFMEMFILVSNFFADLPSVKKMRGIKSVKLFKKFSKENSSYPFTLVLGNSLDKEFRKELLKVLRKGRFINVGIEVVFAYLKLLEFEVENISMIVRGKSMGMGKKELDERINVAYA